jgi:hypothetical protein
MRKYLLFVIVGAMLWPAMAMAQPRRDRDRRDERGERIDRVIRDCEARTNDFRQAVGRAWGRDRHNGDELDRAAERLERSLNRLRESWNRDRDYRRTRGNVGAAIDAGQDVNRILRRHRLSSRVGREWGGIRNELNNLAEVFEQPRVRW